ncbi:hypothetical protein CEXT_382121 [Caerostris extrusa]|uniref:Uncharacterized protein n=1 Tax=Caerostris extrusa TaxID=172846 RepID=A0AAV4VGZ5_CAEEX|nr:hypothetical protein CEXT_382121 [Caerostris extrusa]
MYGKYRSVFHISNRLKQFVFFLISTLSTWNSWELYSPVRVSGHYIPILNNVYCYSGAKPKGLPSRQDVEELKRRKKCHKKGTGGWGEGGRTTKKSKTTARKQKKRLFRTDGIGFQAQAQIPSPNTVCSEDEANDIRQDLSRRRRCNRMGKQVGSFPDSAAPLFHVHPTPIILMDISC